MRRWVPWWLLLVAFVVVPLVEIYLIIQVGQVIGAWWTIAILVADSILGSWLVRREGGRAWRALRTALAEGRMPARELADGVLILFGGTLLLTPGFLSDVLGMLCILPVTRPLGRRVLARMITRRLLGPPGPHASPGPHGSSGPSGSPGPNGPGAPGRSPGDVVRGEVVD